ncbi:MAG: type II CAAX endopeptidase family protein [Pirellulaceae bacterium]
MLWAIPFLLFVTVVLPLLAISSYRSVHSAQAVMPTRATLYVNLLILQLLMGSLAFFAAWGCRLVMPWSARLEFATIGPALGIVVGALVAAISVSVFLDRSSGKTSNLAEMLYPKSLTDWLLWGTAMFAAGVIEEFAYRGVLFGLISQVSNSWWLAALLSALVFGAGHATQGWIGFIASGLFAIGMQWLVFHSEGLLLAIVAHMGYDVIVQLLAPKFASKNNRQSAESKDVKLKAEVRDSDA